MFLANEARKYNLAIGLKNAGDIVSDVLHLVQFAVNEQCVQFSECHKWAPFIKAGKPVFHIEYVNETGAAPVREGLCSNRGPGAGSDGFSTVIKNLRLDGFVGFCNGTNLTTPTE